MYSGIVDSLIQFKRRILSLGNDKDRGIREKPWKISPGGEIAGRIGSRGRIEGYLGGVKVGYVVSLG